MLHSRRQGDLSASSDLHLDFKRLFYQSPLLGNPNENQRKRVRLAVESSGRVEEGEYDRMVERIERIL